MRYWRESLIMLLVAVVFFAIGLFVPVRSDTTPAASYWVDEIGAAPSGVRCFVIWSGRSMLGVSCTPVGSGK